MSTIEIIQICYAIVMVVLFVTHLVIVNKEHKKDIRRIEEALYKEYMKTVNDGVFTLSDYEKHIKKLGEKPESILISKEQIGKKIK